MHHYSVKLAFQCFPEGYDQLDLGFSFYAVNINQIPDFGVLLIVTCIVIGAHLLSRSL